MRQEFFAHLKGGKDIKTALESLYGWLRLKVIFSDEVRQTDSIPLVIRLNRVYYDHFDR